MTITAAIRRKLAELAPRTVHLARALSLGRDPATKATSSDRRAYLGEDATALELRPTFVASLFRRRYYKKRVGKRTVKVHIPGRKTVPTTKIIGLRYRGARWWWPGLLAIEVEPGHGDPWRWSSLDGTWRLRWYRSSDAGLTMLYRRLSWVYQAKLAAMARKYR
jgi:hypothetical protein